MEGVVGIKRLVHLYKFINILDKMFQHIIVIVTGIPLVMLPELIKLTRNNDKVRIIVLDPTKTRSRDPHGMPTPLIYEWLLHSIQLIRLRKMLKNADHYLLMGTLNFLAVLVARIVLRCKTYIFAGGFCSMFVENLRKKIMLKIIEFLTIVFTHYLIVETPSMTKYIPAPEFLKKIIARRKTFTYGALYVDKGFFRRIRPIDERGNVVGYIGDLSFRRSGLEMIHAFKFLARLRPDIRFLIIGSGELKNRVMDIISKDPVLKSKIMLKEFIPSYTDMPHYMQQLKILVFPSKLDGLPNTILEAMASEVLVVATPIGGIPDVVIENATGFILKDTSVKQIINTLLHVLNLDRQRQYEIALKAKQLVLRYSLDGAIKRYRHIFGC